jgi:hypothetical protein
MIDTMEEITIYFPADGVFVSCQVTWVDTACCRLEEGTVLVESASYGDTIRVSKHDDGTWVFQEMRQPSGLKRHWRLLSEQLIAAQPFQALLAHVMAHDGYWQQDFGGVIDIYLPTTCPIDLEADVDRMIRMLTTGE